MTAPRILATIGVFASMVLSGYAQTETSESPPTENKTPSPVGLTPKQLLESVPERLALFENADAVPELREFSISDRATPTRVAVGWVREILAPLQSESCEPVLDWIGYSEPQSVPSLAARPVAEAPAAQVLWVPNEVAPLTPNDVELLRGSGLIGVEVALAGEWARFAAARHTGPAPRDPLLRLARASRLEGVARLAGLKVVLSGSGLNPADLGSGLLKTDIKDRSGLPSSLTREWSHPLDRAMALTYYEDGLRWALFHYLRGGVGALAAALERPATGPESLLRPGVRRSPSELPPGCHLGPRGAAAVLAADPEAEWVDGLVADSITVRNDTLLGWMEFDSSVTADRAVGALRARGIEAERRGLAVISRKRKTPRGISVAPGN